MKVISESTTRLQKVHAIRIKNYNDVYKNALKDPTIDKNSTEFLKLEETIDALQNANDTELPFEYIGVKQKATDAGIADTIDIFKFDI